MKPHGRKIILSDTEMRLTDLPAEVSKDLIPLIGTDIRDQAGRLDTRASELAQSPIRSHQIDAAVFHERAQQLGHFARQLESFGPGGERPMTTEQLVFPHSFDD
ncbi:MAG TPA: hypothetical protein VK983_03355 [Candidatus Limnocylindrales bacterium]|nr:hypothetical protein [Candidatus Limnocylindrales bacterium]